MFAEDTKNEWMVSTGRTGKKTSPSKGRVSSAKLSKLLASVSRARRQHQRQSSLVNLLGPKQSFSGFQQEHQEELIVSEKVQNSKVFACCWKGRVSLQVSLLRLQAGRWA